MIKTRLINGYKTNIGKISKQILDRVNRSILTQTGLNQWKNTQVVIDWFTNFRVLRSHKFISFDIVDFYPSISRDLLLQALNFARKYENITDHEIEIILHAKKNLLYSNGAPWQKINSDNSVFDLPMGGWDSAEACELVGSFLLDQLAPLCEGNVGIYRDDALMIVKGNAGRCDSLRKSICDLFGKYGLRVTVEANVMSVNFLDVTFDLHTHSYKPYTKPNSNIAYVDSQSNHPPSVLKNIPFAVNKRLNNLSSSEANFYEAAPPYQLALDKSGYDFKLHYTGRTHGTETKRTRTRNKRVIWFNPPWSKNVSINIGRKFLQLLDDCFPPSHPLRRVLNRHTVKISYSCLPNFDRTVKAHNRRILSDNNNDTSSRTCNCYRNRECPLDGKCLSKNIVYQATVSRPDSNRVETYVGCTSTTFKLRLGNHIQSFTNPTLEDATKLSQYIGPLVRNSIPYNIKWKILKQCHAYNSNSKTCSLCLNEKHIILCYPELCSLNSKFEVINTCIHRRAHLLKHFNNN